MIRVLHLEDDLAGAELTRRTIERAGVDVKVDLVSDGKAFAEAWSNGDYDIVLSDHDVPGFSGLAALNEIRQHEPHTPFVFVCGVGGKEREVACFEAGADDFVSKDELWRLPYVVRRLARTLPANNVATMSEAEQAHRDRALPILVNAVKELSRARSMEAIALVVRSAARQLNGADGATFVLRDEGECYYFDEDAIAPLWKGSRFPLEQCLSGWVMTNKVPAVIPDIYQDERVPVDAYRPTFVKSIVMVPVRKEAPLAAIGNYWATPHQATISEIDFIQTLADSTSIAMENVRVYEELEKRVRDRTLELEAVNKDLEAYSYSVSHDLRNPVGQVIGFAELLREDLPPSVPEAQRTYVEHILSASRRMNEIIDDLLRLGRISRSELVFEETDLSGIARNIVIGIDRRAPERKVEWKLPESLVVRGDARLLGIVLENLLSNAHKYSGKRDFATIQLGEAEPKEGARVFFVRDNGAGFDMTQASRLFTPYGRLHSATDFAGTGVGLATAQRIVHRHGGRIWAEAAVDKGATFFFSLPDAQEHPAS